MRRAWRRAWHNAWDILFGNGHNAEWRMGYGVVCLDCGERLSDDG